MESNPCITRYHVIGLALLGEISSIVRYLKLPQLHPAMLQINPLTSRSRLLLLRLSLQCHVAQQQLRSFRQASSASSSRPAKPRTIPQTPKIINTPKPTLPPPIRPRSNKVIDTNAGGSSDRDHTPRLLSAALGLPNPPLPGQNTGIDTRPWRQRRDDFLNYDKHLERRASLTKQVAKPYFREWTNMQYSKGTSANTFPRNLSSKLTPPQARRSSPPQLSSARTKHSTFPTSTAVPYSPLPVTRPPSSAAEFPSSPSSPALGQSTRSKPSSAPPPLLIPRWHHSSPHMPTCSSAWTSM